MSKKGMFTKTTQSIVGRNKIHTLNEFLDETRDDDNIYSVPIDKIGNNPYQPRKIFDEEKLQELSNSIKQSGVIQPIVIRQEEDGSVVLIAGERRLRASKMAGLEKIPAIVSKGNPIEISLIENLQRENLKPFEEAEALKRMVDEYKYSQDKLASVMGKSISTISETLSLNKIPNSVKDKFRHAEISKRTLIEVAKQKTSELMVSLLDKITKYNLKSKEVRELTRKPKKESTESEIMAYKKAKSFNKFLSKTVSEIDDKNYSEFLKEISEIKEKIDDFLNSQG